MTSRTAFISRALIIYLCAVLLLPLLPAQAAAQVSNKAKKKVRVQLGKPQVWSIGQAHYLLANMRQVNRELKTHMPTDSELNPNAVNATRIQILKTLLNVEGQFSQKDAIGNQAAIRENQISLRNREQAQADLPAKQRKLAALDQELVEMDIVIKEKEVRLEQIRAERLAKADDKATPPVKAPPPSKDENDREVELELKRIERAQKKAQRDAVATEVTNLNTAATGTVGGPSSLAEPVFSTAPRELVGDLAPLITRELSEAAKTTPSVAASIALDNYIAMQYEIIAKQMTLLRDELGPEERVIFVELPTSFYTVPCKADNHMIQLQWEVEDYLEDENKLASIEQQGLRTDFEEIERERVKQLKATKATPGQKNVYDANYHYRWESVKGDSVPPSTDDQPHRYAVRALDIIPRQSALNVNSTYNTISQVNFLGVLKFISGLGIKVDYQRQQELYEQYLQQEVFASGYGKGGSTFGWTFAPLPGTKRVAPGVRTTYAILAVPRKASAIQLKVKAITYSKGGTPNYDKDSSQLVAENTMIVRIPNEFTENFHVKEAIYTSVRKGERVGVLLKGDYFSPQLGVSVNGVPLTRALSLTSNESLDATAPGTAVAGVQGVYELISSNELYLTFSVTDKNIATPTITLVTPEKTSAINFFKLKVNYHAGLTSLQDISKTEPMFFDELDVTQSLRIIGSSNHRLEHDKLPVPFIQARLDGKGLLRNAEIYIDDRSTPLKHLEDVVEGIVKNLNNSMIDSKMTPEEKKQIQEYETNNPGEEFPDKSRLRIETRERLKKTLVDEQVEEARIKLKAQGKRLTPKEEDRLRELKSERLDNDSEFFKALRKKLSQEEFIECQVTLIKKQEPTISDKEARERAEQKVKDGVLAPDSNVEYVDQDSTGGYRLYFKQPQKAKWSVRYRNNTKQGYEEKVFEVERAFPLPHKTVSYDPGNKTLNLQVTLEFFTDDVNNNPITGISIPIGEGNSIGSPIPQGGGKYHQTFEILPESIGQGPKAPKVPRDHITVTVERTRMAPQTVTVVLPLQPEIVSIENPNHDEKAWGFADEEPAVVIRGFNLHRVDKVFFGSQEATKVGEPGRTEMVVTVPRGELRLDIKSRQVPVRLQTDAASGKSLSSNIAFYTYVRQ